MNAQGSGTGMTKETRINYLNTLIAGWRKS